MLDDLPEAPLIDASVPDSELKEFEGAIKKGQILLFVDLPAGRGGEVEDLIRRHHPKLTSRVGAA